MVTVGVVSFLGFLDGMLVFAFFAECKIHTCLYKPAAFSCMSFLSMHGF